MKKSLVALAILGTFAGAASAATSVTLYGRVEVDYRDATGKGDFDLGAPLSGSTHQQAIGSAVQGLVNRKPDMVSATGARWGIAGQEDLGNGVAAVFRLESRLYADDGQVNARLFDREATVGLKGAFGEIKFGRAISAMESMLGGVSGTHGVADVNLYSTALSRHSNGAFYTYNNSGITFGADVTTKGGQNGNVSDLTVAPASAQVTTEGANYQQVGWGARLGYAGNGLIARIGYQNDGDAKNAATGAFMYHQREVGGLLAYNFNEVLKVPVLVGVAYTKGEGSSKGFLSDSNETQTIATPTATDKGAVKNANTLSAIIRTWFSPKDTAYVLYQKRTSKCMAASAYTAADGTTSGCVAAGEGATKLNAYALGAGYEHSLSKRTMVFADLVYLKANTVNTEKYNGKVWAYGAGIRHNF